MPHRPNWFRDDEVFVSFADTCGINKDGNTLFTIDPLTGKRTGVVDDRLAEDVDALLDGRTSQTGRWVSVADIGIGAPRYYDTRFTAALADLLAKPEFAGFASRTLGSLIEEGLILSLIHI